MDWGDAPAWGALLLSAGAIVISWKTRSDGKRSADASEKSAAAAEAAAQDGRRSANAAVRGVEIAQASLRLQQDAMTPKVKLLIRQNGTGLYALRNVGDATASNLALVEEDGHQVQWVDPLPLGNVYPGDARSLVFPAAANRPSRLSFTWDGQGEPVPVSVD